MKMLDTSSCIIELLVNFDACFWLYLACLGPLQDLFLSYCNAGT